MRRLRPVRVVADAADAAATAELRRTRRRQPETLRLQRAMRLRLVAPAAVVEVALVEAAPRQVQALRVQREQR